jgi:hypothetical protein
MTTTLQIVDKDTASAVVHDNTNTVNHINHSDELRSPKDHDNENRHYRHLITDDNSYMSNDYIDHHVDELQTYNTALCYLCSINADVDVIENFLYCHPEALLMEGICLLPEDSARYILEQHTQQCHCEGLHCHLNRIRVIDLIEKGFIAYRSKHPPTTSKRHTTTTPLSTIDWGDHFTTLVQVEHEIRSWRMEELTMRNVLIELSIEIRTYHVELKRLKRLIHTNIQYPIVQHRSTPKLSAISKLVCTLGSNHPIHDKSIQNVIGQQQHLYERRINVLEYQIKVTSNNLQSVQQEHTNLIQKIRHGRRTQFNVFKLVFHNCLRYDICSLQQKNTSNDQLLIQRHDTVKDQSSTATKIVVPHPLQDTSTEQSDTATTYSI